MARADVALELVQQQREQPRPGQRQHGEREHRGRDAPDSRSGLDRPRRRPPRAARTTAWPAARPRAPPPRSVPATGPSPTTVTSTRAYTSSGTPRSTAGEPAGPRRAAAARRGRCRRRRRASGAASEHRQQQPGDRDLQRLDGAARRPRAARRGQVGPQHAAPAPAPRGRRGPRAGRARAPCSAHTTTSSSAAPPPHLPADRPAPARGTAVMAARRARGPRTASAGPPGAAPSCTTRPCRSATTRREPRGHRRVVRGDQQRPAGRLQRVDGGRGGRRVEPRGRLVGEQQLAAAPSSARTSATRCRSPPDSSRHRPVQQVRDALLRGQPAQPLGEGRRGCARAQRPPARRRPAGGCCPTPPRCARAARARGRRPAAPARWTGAPPCAARGSYGSRPATRTLPAVRGPAPSRACSSVVLPAPLRPSTTTARRARPPRSTSHDASSPARIRPRTDDHRSSPSRVASRRTSS